MVETHGDLPGTIAGRWHHIKYWLYQHTGMTPTCSLPVYKVRVEPKTDLSWRRVHPPSVCRFGAFRAKTGQIRVQFGGGCGKKCRPWDLLQ